MPNEDKAYMLDVLPYSENLEGTRAETVFGYSLPGYGYGCYQELFATEDLARGRLAYLQASGIVESYSLYVRPLPPPKHLAHWSLVEHSTTEEDES